VDPGSRPEPPEKPDWETRYRYLLADFDNYRKRAQRELGQAVERAKGELLLRTIDLHEGIEKVLETLPSDSGALREGLELILRNFSEFLRSESVEPVARRGEPFHPGFHEAVGQIPATPEAPAGTVAVIVQQGYRGPSGLLRPAKVLVAEAPTAPENPPAEATG
jgi:molecular chaperone GrpE